MTTNEKPETLSVFKLEKSVGSWEAICVIFRTYVDGTTRVYSYGNYTDYVVDTTIPTEEARGEWKRLVGEGFKRAALETKAA